MRRALAVTTVLALSSLHCGGGMYAPGKAASKSSAPSSGASPSSPGGKFDFTTEMKKESSGLQTFALAAPDGAFTASVTASSAPKVTAADDKSYAVVFDIGSKRPMDCAVFKKRVDPASTVWNLGVEPIVKQPKNEVLGVELGADDDRSVLTLVMAALNEANEAIVFKVTVVALADAAVICRHEEIGYVATAKAVTLELARSLKMNRPAPRAARFHDLTLIKLDGTSVGLVERFLLDGENGAAFEMEYGATVFGLQNGEVVAEDDVSVTETDKDGLVKTITKGEGTPKGLTKRLVLDRKGATDYEVDGEVGGNKVHTRFKSKKPLRGMSLVAQDVMANARAPKTATTFTEETWASFTPPGEIRVATYTRATPFDANAPSYSVTSGDDNYTMTYDAQGLPTRMAGKLKESTLEATRLFAKGNPQRKK
jgi:hypothetical protein